MEQLKTIGLKFIATLALLYFILGLYYNIPFGYVFLITVVHVLLTFFIGDVGILPRTNNLVGTIADFGLSLVIIWAMTFMLTNYTNSLWIGFVSAIGIALFEFAFHRYFLSLTKNVRGTLSQNESNLTYQTEVSEEITPDYEDQQQKNQ